MVCLATAQVICVMLLLLCSCARLYMYSYSCLHALPCACSAFQQCRLYLSCSCSFTYSLLPHVLCCFCPLQNALEELMCPHGVSAVLPAIFEALVAHKWQTNEGACNMIKAVATRCPANVAVCMPEIVPVLTQALGNARQAVKDAAAAAMTACMNTGRRAALGGLAAGLRQ